MSGTTLTWDLSELDSKIVAALERLTRSSRNRRTLLESIGGYLESSTRRRFERGSGPGGVRWQAAGRGGQTLRDSGRLMGSITYRVFGDAVQTGSNLIYAAIHQFGGVIRAKSGGKLRFRGAFGWRSVDEVTMPARPYLGIDGDDEREIREIVNDWLQDLMRRR